MPRRLFALFAALLATHAHAGAWTQTQGEGLAIAQANYYSTGSYFDTEGSKQSQPRYRKYELQPYLEYGATDWLTVGGTGYLQAVSQSGNRNYGLADPELFTRVRLYSDEKQVFSLQPLVKFASSFRDGGNPRGGSKSMDIELSALYGRSLNLLSPRDYTDVRIGYRKRDHGLSPQIRSDIALGLNLTGNIQLIPALRTTFATAPTDMTAFAEGGDLDYTLVKAELTGLYRLNEQQWLQAGISSHVAGVQTGNGYGLTLGFAQRF